MIKPKGVWLETTELTEVKEAQVIKGPSVADVVQQQTGSSQSRGKKPILIGALAVCCCVLIGLVGMHVYPAFSAAAPQAATMSLEEPADTDLLLPSYGVIITADGQDYITVCRDVTVAEALHQVGVVVGENDEISLPLDTLIESDTAITVSRLYTRVETETEEIAPTISRVDDATMPAGTSKVLEEGEPGVRENTVSISYRDDEEIERTVISSRVLQEPGITTVAQGISLASRSASAEPATVEAGSGPDTITINGTEMNYSRMLTVESTAYTWTGNTTATGTWPDRGQVAVDPRVIPLGSKLYVEGYGFATATDTGGAIKGNIIDVYFSSYDECIQWGRKHGLTVYILE